MFGIMICNKPMSSYLLAIAIGKYNKKVEYSKSGIPLEMYYYPEDSSKSRTNLSLHQTNV